MGLRQIAGRRRSNTPTGVARRLSAVKENDRYAALEVAKHLSGWGLSGDGPDRGVSSSINGVEAKTVLKVTEGRPNIVDHIKNGDVALVVNTVGTAASHADSLSIRRGSVKPRITTARPCGGHEPPSWASKRFPSKKGIDHPLTARIPS